eukprot:5636375-Pleurochrysis_carterae.AAC.1
MTSQRHTADHPMGDHRPVSQRECDFANALAKTKLVSKKYEKQRRKQVRLSESVLSDEEYRLGSFPSTLCVDCTHSASAQIRWLAVLCVVPTEQKTSAS